MDRVKDKVVIVTGGGSGIGRATCLLLAQEGAKVAVTDVNDTNGKETLKMIKDANGTAEYWHLDTSKESEVELVVKSIHQTFGRIDGLVNNAGIPGPVVPHHLVETEKYDMVMAVNVKGVFFCTKHVIPFMLESGGGSIVNLSSVAGIVGSAGPAAYTATKGAVRLMTKSDALIYAKNFIRVNSVHPGFIETNIFNVAFKSLGFFYGLFRKIMFRLFLSSFVKKTTPIDRIGQPEDIANGILFLISDESAFMTGSELVIDGGFTTQ